MTTTKKAVLTAGIILAIIIYTVMIFVVGIIMGAASQTRFNLKEEQQEGQIFGELIAGCRTRTSSLKLAKDLLNLINEYRVTNDLQPLQNDSELANAAAHKGYEYSTTRQWDHTINGRKFSEIYADCNVELGSRQYLGENLAKGFGPDAQKVFEAWKKSPTHNAIMLDENPTKAGIYFGNKWNDYYVVLTTSK